MPRPDKGTRQKLIDTAADLIWTSSYGSVSVDDICRAANVKKGSFYHYFPSKADLAIAAMEEHFAEDLEPYFQKVFAANVPFVQQIENFAESILEEQRIAQEKYGRVCGCPLAALGSEMIGEESQILSAKVQEMFGKCQDYLKAAISSAIAANVIDAKDADEKVRELHDFTTGLMMMGRINNTLDGLEHDLKPGMQRILGLAVEQPILKKSL